MNKCDVCGRETETYVAASALGATSFAYCEDCLASGLEPYDAMVSYIAYAGLFPEDINPTYRNMCRDILAKLNIAEEQFIADVIEEIKNGI